MYDSTRTVAVTMAILTVVGFGIAPMTAVATPSENSDTAYQLDGSDQLDDGGLSTQAEESGPFPEEVCTDLLGMIHDEAPYDMLVWVDDLPSEAQPPGVPWSVITPKSIAGILVGATPNQCEIQDPNDPSFDPIQDDDDNLAPDGDGDVQQGEDGRVLFIVNGTLDNTSEGPSVDGTAGLDLAENGTLDPDATLNDGEKDYGVDPQLKYWSDGTTYFDTDVFVFGTRLGTVMDCTGPECTFSTRGLPNFVEYPSLPSHSDSDPDAGSGGDGGDGSDGGDDDGTDDGEDGTDDGTGGTGTDGDSTDGTDGAGGSGSGGDSGDDDGTNSTNDGGSGDDGAGETGGDADGDDGSGSSNDGGSGDGTGDDGGDGGQSGDDADGQTRTTQNGDGGNQGAQQAAAADGSGLGVVVAMIVFILGAAAIAPRD